MPKLSFWYDFASTYSYLSAMRIETLAADRGIRIEWHPFLLGPIFKKQGWDTSPFNLNRAKGAYMWRDMERQCVSLGLPFVRPIPFPQNSLPAARIAYHGRRETWIGAFTRAVYHMQFALGEDISNPELLAALLLELGAPAKDIMHDIESAEVKIGLRAEVAEAERLGIFGAPSFVTEHGELFWGNDRLDEALDAAFMRVG
ncbi:2-hydroxychromene-2-carboxylate isomerase [Pseudovibrio exalbescens]|uniref:2-hydroxychromene-2-carboxylate isomerase n=1 Tax=Pseudovibrio exalbescens TaxID=197461 RepID=A0A1U7JJL2_9HYPH|nr:2-hydroxychromene-2-carboxylate isomerase [Pseudovibrio exalbescens]OKL44909.1 disulfide bond formation protein DsbA [Pseudovibrio exalbescens]